ncbi:hypothetical protein M011DRAFT_189523 [Sporormia fimetaria CBS 119925]|uniref:Uncharacterized protein n=1 Tax=Sporormia fimetaria CBS 119925 TaxID=1340428 RepID=A0A6A6VLF6_9PLEO|nr:hypothetical protein M011DRAFT_189523 [Sporormia fimetaria CBS 119925]
MIASSPATNTSENTNAKIPPMHTERSDSGTGERSLHMSPSQRRTSFSSQLLCRCCLRNPPVRVTIYTHMRSLQLLGTSTVRLVFPGSLVCATCIIHVVPLIYTLAPAKEALEYEDTVMSMDPKHFADGNPFVGDPREELDQAWDGLLENIQISLTADEFSQVRPQLGDNRSTLVLPDGGHIVRFRVYHELHCLKWIRKWMHREHYWPDLTGYALHERRWHIEHCLEEFRMHAMCHPSLAPATFYFLDRKTSDEITADGTHVEKCVNWDSLQKWTGERRVDLNTVDRKALVEGG